MGAIIGLLFGLGVLLIIMPREQSRPRPERATLHARLSEALAQAGIEAVSPGRLLSTCAALGLLVALGVVAISQSPAIALAFGLISSYAPLGLVNYQRRRRQAEMRDVWPEVVDNLASGIRAGLSLPEALAQIGERGPQALRRPFRRFAVDYRAHGRFGKCLDRLKDDLADPVGDRVVEIGPPCAGGRWLGSRPTVANAIDVPSRRCSHAGRVGESAELDD